MVRESVPGPRATRSTPDEPGTGTDKLRAMTNRIATNRIATNRIAAKTRRLVPLAAITASALLGLTS